MRLWSFSINIWPLAIVSHSHSLKYVILMEKVRNMQSLQVLPILCRLFIGKCIEELQFSFYYTSCNALALPNLVVTDDLNSLTKHFNQQSLIKKGVTKFKILLTIDKKKGVC